MAAHGASQDDIRDYVIEQNNVTEYEDGMIKLDPMVLPDNMNLLNDRDPKATHTLVGMSTVVQAVVNFYNSNNTFECIANAMKYPCDADTVAAISGGIAAAYYGDVPFIDDILKSEIARNRSAENKFIIDHINMA